MLSLGSCTEPPVAAAINTLPQPPSYEESQRLEELQAAQNCISTVATSSSPSCAGCRWSYSLTAYLCELTAREYPLQRSDAPLGAVKVASRKQALRIVRQQHQPQHQQQHRQQQLLLGGGGGGGSSCQTFAFLLRPRSPLKKPALLLARTLEVTKLSLPEAGLFGLADWRDEAARLDAKRFLMEHGQVLSQVYGAANADAGTFAAVCTASPQRDEVVKDVKLEIESQRRRLAAEKEAAGEIDCRRRRLSVLGYRHRILALPMTLHGCSCPCHLNRNGG